MEQSNITYQFLKEITDGFSKERKLGEGAYGKVYRVRLRHTLLEEIATKVLHFRLGQDDEQFRNEFDNLMWLKHDNIVRLVGYCYETQHRHMQYEGRTVFAEETYRALCFEYMHNGSLQNHLSEECAGLDWYTRYKIIKGICEDFGLSKLFSGEETRIAQSPIGTFGYLPLEYLLGNIVSKKLDIYSMGVVMIKIIADTHGAWWQDTRLESEPTEV
ncbi:cysteine-rich receptor-like protein kinase 41 [Phragmites australis]|uniref:cysteine-rich receptor-like protein kinase 41 n=1 Tax=Phragmites australis TaxID=29695 RepID=UPI002D79B4B0|nr:cysteine-rich receptor-like protein kinase 41 [Phragmites australis]